MFPDARVRHLDQAESGELGRRGLQAISSAITFGNLKVAQEPSWTGKYQSGLSQSNWLNWQGPAFHSQNEVTEPGHTHYCAVPQRETLLTHLWVQAVPPCWVCSCRGASWLAALNLNLWHTSLRAARVADCGPEWMVCLWSRSYLPPIECLTTLSPTGDPLTWSSWPQLPWFTKHMSQGRVCRLQPAWVRSTIFLQKERPGVLKGLQSSW